MKTSLFTAAFALTATIASAQAISLEDAHLPENLSDADVMSLAQGFCADSNTTGLNVLTLGVAESRAKLLDGIFQDVAKNCASSADTLVFTIQQNLPDIGLASFATMSSYLQANNQTAALASLNANNTAFLAQLETQGLGVETAAGPSELNFDAVLENLDIPVENPAQLSAN